jgi:hypothetical protein
MPRYAVIGSAIIKVYVHARSQGRAIQAGNELIREKLGPNAQMSIAFIEDDNGV